MRAEASDLKSATDKRSQELLRYFTLFGAAFDEFHDIVQKQANTSGQYISAHHDYPRESSLPGGFPSFKEAGFYDDKSPRDYAGIFRPRGLFGLLAGSKVAADFPKGVELASFLRNSEIGNKLKLNVPIYKNKLSDVPAEHLVADAVERYFHLYGLNTAIDPARRDAIIMPLIIGTVDDKLNLSLVVPIVLTHFEADHFRLSKTSYIARIPRKLQLGRARLRLSGSGVVDMVAGGATHALVINDWSIEVSDVNEVSKSLNQSPSNDAMDAIESLFAALRIATGIETGFAQILWVPRRWALDYYCDLTPVYGSALRRYPNEFDNYAWSYQRPTVTENQLKEVGRIYRSVLNNQSEGIRLALKRLNACLTRSDEADAILDGTIGLELLLSDDEQQALSYKLRLRAAALALMHGDPAYPASDVFSKVKRLYKARSDIVHGKRKTASKQVSDAADTLVTTENRLLASNLLRFVLDVLLTKPEYQKIEKIDQGILLRGDEFVKPTKTKVKGRRKRTRAGD
jgi:hypothetical protein